jgi:hypothetical protein
LRTAQRAVPTDEGAKDSELFAVQLLACTLNLWQIVMRIDGCRGVTGKMFTAARDPLLSHCVVERAGVADNLLDRLAVTTAVQRIVGGVIEGNVEHWTKIEIKTEQAQQSSGDVTVTADKIDIVFIAQLLGVRRLIADQTQSRNAAAFLINRDDRLDLGEIAQIIDQFAQLRGALDVAPKKNETTGLHSPKQFRGFRIQFFSRNTGKDKLAKRIIAHALILVSIAMLISDVPAVHPYQG